jgi:hypothetical protein
VERLRTSNLGERSYSLLDTRAKLRSLLRTKADPKVKPGSSIAGQGEFDQGAEVSSVCRSGLEYESRKAANTASFHKFLHGLTDTFLDNLGLLQWNKQSDIASPYIGWIIFGCIGRPRDGLELVVNSVAPLCIRSRILDVRLRERTDAPFCLRVQPSIQVGRYSS